MTAARYVKFFPPRYAQFAGALYLAIIILGAFAEGFVADKLVVSGDVELTSRNILASLDLWRLGIIANFIVVVLAVPLLWIEYLLLRPVNKQVMLLAVMFNLVSLAVEAVSKSFLILVIPILNAVDFQAAFSVNQLHVLTNIALRSHDVAFNVALIFFGFTCLLYGLLIFQSGFLPRIIGLLMQFAGICYIIACSAALFAPEFSKQIIPAILVPPLIGESSFCLWLLIKGVDVVKWQERESNSSEQ